jgi:type IV secretion system protein VirD4
VGGLIFLIILAGLCVLVYKRLKNRKKHSLETWQEREAEASSEALARLGPTHTERMRAIDAMFEQQTATMSATYCAWWERRQDPGEAGQDAQGKQKPARRVQARVLFTVNRNLAGMDNRERTYLRVAESLNSAANGSERAFKAWRTALIWGDGKGVPDSFTWYDLSQGDDSQPIAAAIRQEHMSVEQTLSNMQTYASQSLSRSDLNPDYRSIMSELSEAIAPTGASSWLKSSDLGASPYAKHSEYPLHIGSLPDGTALTYSGEGSMVTIAPPGSGKTQCNVFPNLLSWQGPAVVLDISGDIFEHTAAWRAENVGPVFKFSPLEPEDSHKYNPLTFVRREPDFLWEDSRLLAEMMIVPAMSSDPFWENEARTVLTAAIAYVCYSNPPEQRPMRAVLDVMFGGAAWDQMILGLRMAIDVHVMTQHATSLSSMNEKTLSSVLQTARSSLGAWAGERVARATSSSDWDPLDLRGSSNPTIYIYIRPNEVDSYLSLLRVFIGQHIRILTGGVVPPREAPPILFMLDELPRLRNMQPIDEALSIGRKYGLRLWMFAQSVGQFQASYENADGMLGSCAIRTFMNPGGADGLAERLSEELGYVDSVNDNSRARLVEAVELSGPKYRDLQIVFASGGRPATVAKDFAYQDAELSRRMSMGSLVSSSEQ